MKNLISKKTAEIFDKPVDGEKKFGLGVCSCA